MLKLEKVIRPGIGPAPTRYDYVIVATPAGLCRSTQIGIDAAHQVVLAVSCGIYGLKGMVAVIDWMAGIYNRFARPMPSIKVVLNNYDERRRFDREFKREILHIFSDDLFQTHIRTSARIIEAAAQGMSVVESSPFCSAAEDFKWLSREILGMPPGYEPSAGSDRSHEGKIDFEMMLASGQSHDEFRDRWA